VQLSSDINDNGGSVGDMEVAAAAAAVMVVVVVVFTFSL